MTTNKRPSDDKETLAAQRDAAEEEKTLITSKLRNVTTQIQTLLQERDASHGMQFEQARIDKALSPLDDEQEKLRNQLLLLEDQFNAINQQIKERNELVKMISPAIDFDVTKKCEEINRAIADQEKLTAEIADQQKNAKNEVDRLNQVVGSLQVLVRAEPIIYTTMDKKAEARELAYHEGEKKKNTQTLQDRETKLQKAKEALETISTNLATEQAKLATLQSNLKVTQQSAAQKHQQLFGDAKIDAAALLKNLSQVCNESIPKTKDERGFPTNGIILKLKTILNDGEEPPAERVLCFMQYYKDNKHAIPQGKSSIQSIHKTPQEAFILKVDNLTQPAKGIFETLTKAPLAMTAKHGPGPAE